MSTKGVDAFPNHGYTQRNVFCNHDVFTYVRIYVCTRAFRQNQLYHLRPLVIFSNLPLSFLGVFISSPEALFSLTAQFKSAMYKPS